MRCPRRSALALLVAAAYLTAATSGCLSNQYRIDKQELARLAELPPEARGQRVRVVQELGDDREPVRYVRVADGPAPWAPGWMHAAPYEPPPGQTTYGSTYVGFHGDLYLGGPVGRARSRPAAGSWSGGSAVARPAAVAAPEADGRRVARPSPSGGSSGGPNISLPSGGGGRDDLVVLVVLVVAIAVVAVVGLAATEGARYDGAVTLSPAQPLYLEYAAGEERVVFLGDLSREDAAAAEQALVVEGEGPSFGPLGRAPLDRRGFAYKVDVGALATALDDYSLVGLASNVQLGYFFHRRVGLLATAALGGGSDPLARTFVRSAFGLELQLFPIALGRLHLGGFANGGRLVDARADGTTVSGPVLGGGALLELEVTTRFAVALRGGWSWARLEDGSRASGATLTVGFAVY